MSSHVHKSFIVASVKHLTSQPTGQLVQLLTQSSTVVTHMRQKSLLKVQNAAIHPEIPTMKPGSDQPVALAQLALDGSHDLTHPPTFTIARTLSLRRPFPTLEQNGRPRTSRTRRYASNMLRSAVFTTLNQSTRLRRFNNHFYTASLSTLLVFQRQSAA